MWGRGLQEDEGQVEVERVVPEEKVVQHDMEEDEDVGGMAEEEKLEEVKEVEVVYGLEKEEGEGHN